MIITTPHAHTVGNQITFECNLFIGYDKQRLLDEDKVSKISQTETHLKTYKSRLLWATWCAGIAGGLVLLFQVFVYLYPVHKDYPCWLWDKDCINCVKKK